MVVPAGAEHPHDHLPADKLNAVMAELGSQAREVLDDGKSEVELRFLVDMRLRGQIHELSIELPEPPLDNARIDGLPGAFLVAYEEHFGPGSAFAEAGLEVMTVRVEGWVRTDVALPSVPLHESREVTAPRSRPIRLPGLGRLEVGVFDGMALSPGDYLEGPAAIELPGTTVLVGNAERATIDGLANVVIEQRGSK
jgi:N-methylhydantoinase A